MTPKPEVLNLLEKLQNFTPDEVDEERGSFKIGDSVIYDMLGGALSNSDLIKTLGIKEHTLRISHNEAIAKITETAGEEVSRYNIAFEDGFIIKDVAASELKSVIDETRLSATKIAQELFSKQIGELTVEEKAEVKQVMADQMLKSNLPIQPGAKVDEAGSGLTAKDVTTSELKAPEPSGIQPKPQEEPDLDAEELHLEDYSKDDLEKVKSKSAKTGDAIRKVEDDELQVAPDRLKKESKIDEVEEGELKVGDRVKDNESHTGTIQKAPIDPLDLDKVLVEYDDTGKRVTVHISRLEKIPESKVNEGMPYEEALKIAKQPEDYMDDQVNSAYHAISNEKIADGNKEEIKKALANLNYVISRRKEESKTDEQVIREEKCPKCGSDSFTEGNEAGDYMCAECGYDESVAESKLKEDVATNKHQLKIAIDTLKMPDAMVGVMGGMTKQEARSFLRKQGWDNIKIAQLEESELAEVEEETELTPSRAEFKKIGDNQLRKLYKNVCRSCDYYKKDKTQPEKVEACEKAMKQYEEEMRARGLIESKFSFMRKQKPLWLCNECYKTFRNAEAICILCESKEVERILDEQSKEVFKVTWDTEDGKEESTTVMAFDKTSAEKEAERPSRKITKVEGPITEEPRKEEAKVPFDQDKDGEVKIESKLEEGTKPYTITWQNLDEPHGKFHFFDVNAHSKEHAEAKAIDTLKRDGIPEKFIEIKAVELKEVEEKKYPSPKAGEKTRSADAVSCPRCTSRDTWNVEGDIFECNECGVRWDEDSGELLREREQKVIEDEPITAIEIVTSKIDPDAYNIRVVQLPEGSIVILDSVSDREIAIERGKKFAQDLNAKFLGIIDESLKEQEDIFKMSDEELEKLPLHDLGRARETTWQNYRLGSGTKGGMDWKKSWRRLDMVIKKMGESKLKEQEEDDTFSTVAKGIANKETADKLAAEEEGQVVVDGEDDKKFAVLVKKDV